jgi:hypothetical protein
VPEPSTPPEPLFAVSRRHLEVMSDELGVWQHAKGERPDPAHGFCTDDVCRALVVDLLHSRELGWGAVSASVARHIAFLEEAGGVRGRRFRNFRGADGTWLEAEGSEDSHGRAMLSLSIAMNETPDPANRKAARRLFEEGLPAVRTLSALRATASSLLACDGAIRAGAGGDVLAVFEILAKRLAEAFPESMSPDWPWPESTLTYENALIPRALIAAGRRLEDASMTHGGFLVLDWLIESQTSPDGSFSPVGNKGWWPKDGDKSRYDQQPIEAMALILACEAALAVSGDERYRRAAEMAYGWFLGRNDTAVPVAVPLEGACNDGLNATGVNPNQGAESTLAWLTSLERIRALRAAEAGVARVATTAVAPFSAVGGSQS